MMMVMTRVHTFMLFLFYDVRWANLPVTLVFFVHHHAPILFYHMQFATSYQATDYVH